MAGGRPTVVTDEIILKLNEAFVLGCTDLEACFFANISKSTLYKYQGENPEFTERKEELKENPVFEARKSVISAMKTDGALALKYLERKKKDEFSLKTESEVKNTVVFDNMSDEELDNAINNLSQEVDEEIGDAPDESNHVTDE